MPDPIHVEYGDFVHGWSLRWLPAYEIADAIEFWSESSRCPSSVDQNGVTRDERRGGGRKEHDGASDIHGFADAMQAGNALDDVSAKRLIRESFVGARRGDKGWRDGVYGDVVLTPFDRQAFGEVRDRGFAGAIDGFRGQRGKSGLRAHVDDASAFLANHDFRGSLSGKERCLHVDCERRVEFFLRDVDGEIREATAGVVDENVQPAEMCGGAVNTAGDLIQVGNIHLQGKRAAAHGFDFAGEIASGADVAQTERDVGSRMSKRERNGPAQPTCGARDQSHLPGKVKFWKFDHRSSSMFRVRGEYQSTTGPSRATAGRNDCSWA